VSECARALRRGGTHDAAREPARHGREADKEQQARAPHRARVAEALVAPHAVLVDHVHDEQAREREEAGDPVDEGDVHGHVARGLVERGVRVRGEDGRVEERPVGDGELAGRGERGWKGRRGQTHEGAGGVDADGAGVLAKVHVRERVHAHPPRVVVRAQGHGGRVVVERVRS
jgi:hypothetical protein